MTATTRRAGDRRRIARGLVVAGLAVGVLAGCGAKRSEIAREAGQEVPGGGGSGGGGSSVKVGFIIVDQTQLNQLLQFKSPDAGDVEGQIRTLVDAVNAEGGIAGKPIEPVIVTYDALTDSPDNEEKLCRTFTEDNPVFAVVLYGQFQSNARPCYAERKTLMIDQTLFPVDQVTLEDLAPYLWQPLLPEYGKLLRGLAKALGDNDYFDSTARLGVIGIDSPENRRVYDDDLAPTLASVGAVATTVKWIDPTSGATLQAGLDQSVLEFKDQNINRVVVVGGSRLLAFLVNTAVPQEYFPRYAVTSFDNPDFLKREMPMALAGSIGISIQPAFDVAEEEYPRPGNDAEKWCIDALDAGGHTFEERANMREALIYCDAVRLLNKAGALLGDDDLTVESLTRAFTLLGEAWQSASNYSSAFAEGAFDGVAGFRATVWEPDCTCYVLAGETSEFPS